MNSPREQSGGGEDVDVCLRFRWQAYHEDRQRHGVQLPLSGRPAGGADVERQ